MDRLRAFYAEHRKMALLAGGLLAVLLLLLYLLAFFQTGADLYDSFLRRRASPYSASAWTYSGKNAWGRVRIDVGEAAPGSWELTYAVPGNPERAYLVKLSTAENRYTEREVVIVSGGVERFRGIYQPESLFLRNEAGEPVLGADFFVSHDGRNPFAEQEPSFYSMAELASGNADTVRGNGALLFLALLTAAFWAVDRRWPRLFFDLRHIWWCVGAEPSELFLSAQRVLWVALPILSVIIALLALLIH